MVFKVKFDADFDKNIYNFVRFLLFVKIAIFSRNANFWPKMDNNGVMTRVPGAKLVSMGGLNLFIVLKIILPKVNKRKNKPKIR